MNDLLREQIVSCRRSYPERSLVVYDLTTGVDFSKPRETAEALADVFFHMDASKWFKEENNSLIFNATESVEVRIADEHNKKIAKTLDDFKKDLKKDEIAKEYAKEIEAAGTYNASLGFMLLGGFMNAMIAEALVRRDQRVGYMGELLQKVMGNVKIETV